MTIPYQFNPHESYHRHLDETLNARRKRTPLSPATAAIVIFRALNHDKTRQKLDEKYGIEETKVALDGFKAVHTALSTNSFFEKEQLNKLKAIRALHENKVATNEMADRNRRQAIVDLNSQIVIAERRVNRGHLPTLTPEVLGIGIEALELRSVEKSTDGLEAWDVLLSEQYPNVWGQPVEPEQASAYYPSAATL